MRVQFPNLKIASGATASNILDGSLLGWLKSLMIYPPAALSGVVTAEASPKSAADSVAADFRTYRDDGADATLTADKTKILGNPGNIGSLRLVTTIAPGADELYGVVGDEEPAIIYH